ncbi:MAG: hypothetical protein JNG88_14690 [Phycisphaerales bacterium]|nr:hypothetical protein [Phycisphaerales bacterium]
MSAAYAQTTFYVNGDCGNDNWAGTSATCAAPNGPKVTIQAGINAASDGDTVVVTGLSFEGQGNVNLDFDGRKITLESAYGPGQCAIDGSQGGRAFRFHSAETTESIVQGFTIRDCDITTDADPGGGAVLIEDSSPKFVNCRFVNNTNAGSESNVRWGGAVSIIDSSTPVFLFCEFIGNSSNGANNDTGGGALWVASNETGGCVISGCRFELNHSGFYGGALFALAGRIIVTHSQFVANDAGDILSEQPYGGGGAIHTKNAALIITNCLFGHSTAPNQALYGSAIDCEGDNLSGLQMSNCSVIENVGIYGALLIGQSYGGRISHCYFWKNNYFDQQVDYFSDIVNDSEYFSLEYSALTEEFLDSWSGPLTQCEPIIELDLNNPQQIVARNNPQGMDAWYTGQWFLRHVAVNGGSDDSIAIDYRDSTNPPALTAAEAGLAPFSTRTDLVGDSSWLDVGYHIWPDCNNNLQIDGRDIATGVVQDCNRNGIPDVCDIANALPEDIDADDDGDLDECECRPNGRTYTLADHFADGFGINIDAEIAPPPSEPENDATLSRNDLPIPLPYLWVPLSGRGSVICVYTGNDATIGAPGDVLGEYRTAPGTLSFNNPSRTAVDLDGNVWIGNRGIGTVTKIGLVVGGTRCNAIGGTDPNGQYLKPPFVYNTCQDRNGDGLIVTSHGLGDVRAWHETAQNTQTEATADDECICKYVTLEGLSNIRHVAVDRENNVWAGGVELSAHDFYRFDGVTGAILDSIELPGYRGGYGGPVTCDNFLWTTHRLTAPEGILSRVNLNTGQIDTISEDVSPYAMFISSGFDGKIWATQYDRDELRIINPSNPTPQNTTVYATGGIPTDRGLAQSHAAPQYAWIANSVGGNGQGSVSRILLSNGTVTDIPLGTNGNFPTGISVDQDGNLWVTCQGTTSDPGLKQITGLTQTQPSVGVSIALPSNANSYSHTDQTGQITLLNTGGATWSAVHDGQRFNASWSMVSWNQECTDGGTPENLQVSGRAHDDVTALPLQAWTDLTLHNGNRLDVPGTGLTLHGRFVELRVRFLGSCPGVDPPTSPTLCDIHVGHGLGDLNCDGNLNNFDIDAFVVALTESEETYNSLYPNCDKLFADIDGNGLVNNFDINPFVALLANPC